MSSPSVDPAQLLEQAGRWEDELRDRGLVDEAAGAQLKEALIRSRGERLDIADDPLLVAMLCGPTAVGKSSLINAIAGAEISRPGLGAATPGAVAYVHECDDPTRLFEYSEALGQFGREAANLVRHAQGELRHKILVDTPDIDSVVQRHHDITGALVHCADLVLFVTSPEKYKDLHSARWVAENRRQRAIAFVLNKWDRSSLGLQYDRRDVVERDFRSLLVAEGFREPIIFKVSTLPVSFDAENDLEALRTWLGEGLDRSAATAIQERRRRAAWGRLSAIIAPVVPAPMSDHPLVKEAVDRLEETRAQAHRMAKSEALQLAPGNFDRSVRPVMPGLLGSWLRLTGGVSSLASPVRGLLGWRAGLGRLQQTAAGERDQEASPIAANGFGRPIAALLARTTADLTREAETARLPLGPVAEAWASEAGRLGQRLAPLPAEAEADLAENALRPSLRRSAGIAALFAIEALLCSVLLLTLWRMGSGFVMGDYVSGALLLNALALIIALLVLGQLAANLFFPALQERLRRAVSQRAESMIDLAWRQAHTALAEHLDAAARLTQQGRELLEGIDVIVRSLSSRAEPDRRGVQQLFGDDIPSVGDREPAEVLADDGEAVGRPARRPPRFD